MAKKKSSKNTVSILPTPNVYTPWGNAVYGDGGYYYSTHDDLVTGDLQNNLTLALKAYQNNLAQLQDPTAAMNNYRTLYGNLMRPKYEQERERSMGEAISGLGNRYFSTFGQQTLNSKAQDQAIAGAQMEKDIYDSGNDAYDRLVNNAVNTSNLASAAQNMKLEPYSRLSQMAGVGGNIINGQNQVQASMYNSRNQLQAAQSQSQNRGSLLSGIAPLVSTAISAFGA